MGLKARVAFQTNAARLCLCATALLFGELGSLLAIRGNMTTGSRIAALASAAMLIAGSAAAAPPDATDGDLYFVNLTKHATSLTLDDRPHAPARADEVQGRPIPAGRHVLHIAVEGRPPIDLPLDLGLDHVAADETGRAFWCVVTVVDANDQLRPMLFQPSDCSKIVAKGLHPSTGASVTAELRGDIYFINTSGQPIELKIDQDMPIGVPNESIFGNLIAPGEHDLHLAMGESRSVDLHVNFDAAHLGRSKSGRSFWCVGASRRPNGSPTAFQFAADKCSELVAEGYEPPAK